MRKRLPLILLMVIVSSLIIGYCVYAAQKPETGVNTPYPLIDTPHVHLGAKTEQTVEHDFAGYCGNTITKIKIYNTEYMFWGGDSVAITDMLLNLDYSKEKMCKCPAEITVDTEFGLGYGINLSESFARSDKGQADLTEEQVREIKAIIDRQCNEKGRVS